MRNLLSTAIITLFLPIVAVAGPKVVILETHWDFGDVPQNSTLQHAFWIKNTGNDTLKILSVKPG